MKYVNQGSQWRKYFRELKSFVMRDLQDYRREDYLELSAGSRRMLLLLIAPVILLLALFLWRYFWGTDLLEKYDPDIAKLMQQTQEIRSEIRDNRQFIHSDSVQEFSKDALFPHHDQVSLPESVLIQRVESLALVEAIKMISLKPYKQSMTLNQSSRKLNRSQAYFGDYSVESLIPRLETISQREALGYLRSQGTEKGSSQIDIPLLELELRICANTASILGFLDSIAQSLLQSSMLFYLEEMQIYDASDLCVSQEYQLLLHFYDVKLLHQLYQIIAVKEGNSELYQYPISLKEVERDMPLFEHRRKQVDQDFADSERKLVDFQQLFSATQDLVGTKRLAQDLPDKGDRYYWYLGEHYQEMLLLGIVLRGSQSFAIVRRGKDHWKSLSLTDTNVIEMTNNYIVILKDE